MLKEAFGSQVYLEDGALNRKWLSSEVFNDESKLKLLNSIVHPIVIEAGKDWANRQIASYTLKEAALLFESGSYSLLDATILIKAPLDVRVDRVMKRDNLTREEVLKRIANQMPEEEKEKLADYIIINDGQLPLLPQIEKIHKDILSF